MLQSDKKLWVVPAIAYCLTIFVSANLFADEISEQIDNSLQPQALTYIGVYDLKQIDHNLTGYGVNFAVICRSITYQDGYPQNDYRPNIKHNSFGDTEFTFYNSSDLYAGTSPHSTSICSILFGQDPNAYNPYLGHFYYQGIIPEAKADIYEFWHFLTDKLFPQSPPDVDIITASIGNQFEDWWTRGFDSLAQHYGIVVVAGIGNGQEACDLPLYPAAGTNVIGVGVVNCIDSNDLKLRLSRFCLAYPEHSSFGPTTDKRCKPDIIAVGNYLAADCNDPNLYKPTGNWSSFATPIVSGTAGLLIQKAKDDPNLSNAVSSQSSNCVIKAILLNSATKLPYWHKGNLNKDDDHFVPLDYIQGAGMLNALAAYNNLTAGQQEPGTTHNIGWDLNQINESNDIEKVYRIHIEEPENKLIAATLTWNRHYQQVYPFDAIVEKDADLLIEVWAIGPNDPNNARLLDYSDSSVDNVEHIYCPADPNYSDYEIIIAYSGNGGEINQPPKNQRYALAWNVSSQNVSKADSWYDLNADGILNEIDLFTWVKNKAKSENSPQDYCMGDINEDGSLDDKDLIIFLKKLNLKTLYQPPKATENHTN
ncbi:MAG: S8 family serine peptidase [Planctomycetota bacterium]|jgi:hypothetical protein